MDGRHVNSPKLSGDRAVLRRERRAPKLVLAASLYKRDFLSVEIRKTHLNEWTSAALERTSRLRSDRPAAQLWQSGRRARSEEHTSELQSPCNIVCRLLLAKKTVKKLLHVSATSISL